MVTEKQIQEIIKMGVSKNTLSKMTLKEIKNLHESMVNSQGFVPIGRMASVKKSETKEVLNVKKGSPEEKDAMSKQLSFNTYEGEMKEGKKTKKKVEKNPFAICTTSLGLEGKKKDDYTKGEDKKFERCVLGVKKSLKEGKNPYEIILEQKMREIVESNLRPTMTKNDLINSILESKTKEKTKEKEKTTTPTRKNPFQPAPNSDPKPKGSGTKEKEKTKEKERTTTTPRKNPFQPAPNTDPRPKGELPSYLSFGKMNIKLKGE
tara:strand:+ start:2473 stop:3261 length:789 start_codon:yes stop_codon:yes gene_type:complete